MQMVTEAHMETSAWSAELRVMVRELQDETLLAALGGLGLVAVVLLSEVMYASDPIKVIVPTVAVVVLGLIVWSMRRWHYLGAAWTLVAGSVTVILTVVAWSRLELAVLLLAIPVGLATVLISRRAGLGIAAGCTLLLVLAPAPYIPDVHTLRIIALMCIWGVIGLLWLTLRPLLDAVRWAWAGYEQNRSLLEQARDQQVQLKQTLQDLTDANVQLTRLRRQAEGLRQVAEAERRTKERFVANVSHELRTPLNMIIGFCEMITQTPEIYGPDISPLLLSDLTVVLRNSQHLSSLINDVLDLSQIEADQMALSKERVSLVEIISAATLAVQPLFRSKRLYLETEVPEDLPLVFCDRTRIREVVLNLLSNAGRFSERGGARVQARQEGQQVVVSVTDTGPGIAEADQERIFRPFEQTEQTVRQRYGGTGLGLNISRSFVELHGGTMWVESQPGQGATFLFRLPIDPPAPHAETTLRWFNPYQPYEERVRGSSLQPALVRPCVVVVESGGSLQQLLSRHMDGVEIVAAADLGEALRGLAEQPAQALLLNEIRVGQALERTGEVTALPYGVPVIICSIPGTEEAVGAMGVADYLLKPISREALLGALDRLATPVETVLVVDDEPDARRLFGRMLTEAGRGYRVVRASDGRQALEILRHQRVDLVLLDLVMPEMDGFRLLALKAQDPALSEIPVILTSARDPLGQPIVSHALAVTCRNGLNSQELLACIESLTAILSKTSPRGDPALTGMPPD
jgi:signal transduction histidine kinase/CheY-like chemotaxis protein